jgi:hypothetical protein
LKSLQLAETGSTEIASGNTAQVVESGNTTGVTVNENGMTVAYAVVEPMAVSYSEVGKPVMVVAVDGTETKAEDGIIPLDNGMQITVIKGKLAAEPQQVPEKKEDEDEDETKLGEYEIHPLKMAALKLAKYDWNKCIADRQKDGYSKESAEKICGAIKAKGVNMSEEPLEMAVTNVRNLISSVDFSKPGSYYITVEIGEDGTVKYAMSNSSTYQNLLMAEEEKVEARVKELTDGYENKLKEKENLISALKLSDGKGVENKPEAPKGPLSHTDLLKMQLEEQRKNK